MIAAAIASLFVLQAAGQPATADDPALQAAVRRFYETQEQEDVAGYLALWSSKGRRPSPEQLKFIFETGDDKFSEIQIVRVFESRGQVRVRVEALRERTPAPRPGSSTLLPLTARIRASLTFEREGEAWKLLREGQPADEIASAMMEASTDAERDALLESEPDLLGPPLLTALARLGGGASVIQNHAGALQVYQQLAAVARRGGFRKEEGEALQNIGNALYFLRRFPEALTAYEQRLALERERQDDAGIASALGGIATIRYSYAEYSEALLRYREALALQERLDDVAGIAFTSISIGNITYLQGDFTAAVAAYRRSLDLNRSMSNADGESRALEGLGRVHLAQGDYSSALEAFEAVLLDSRLQGARDRLGSAAQNAGDVHLRLGNLEAAKAKYNESRGHYEAMKDLSNVGRLLQSIALTEIVAARFAAAEELYVRSGSICAKADDRICSAAAVAGLGYAQNAQEKFWDAAASYRKAAAEFETLGRADDAGRSEIGLSQALLGAGDVAGAVDAAVRARRIAVSLDQDDLLWRALTAEARGIRKLGDTGRALGVARAAVVALDRLAAAALERPAASLTTDAAGALATFIVLQAESGDASGAFATSERLRALDVRAGVATNEREIVRGMTDGERTEERTVSTELLTRLAQLTREKALPKPDAVRVATLEKAVEEAKGARRRSLAQLLQRHPDLRIWRGLGPPAGVLDAAPLLIDRGELIVSFVLDDDALVTLTVTRQEDGAIALPSLVIEAHVMHVNRRQVNASILALQHTAAQNDGAGWHKAMGDLAAIIPPAVHERLQSASKIRIIPHDVLWRLPFEALPAGDHLLGDRATISLSGSLDALIRSNAHAKTRPEGQALAVAAPELGADRAARLKRVAPGWQLRDADTANVEVNAVAATYPDRRAAVLSSTAATERALRDRHDATTLHIAAPFRINSASPLFSPILLTVGGAGGTGEAPPGPVPQASTPPQPASVPSARHDPSDDGSLELREVMNMNFSAAVAVFSDGSATSMRDGAAAADVLQWGWLAAGVPSVLIARWAAPPQAAAVFLAEFHGQLRQGASPSDAVRAAQRLVRSSPDTSAPIYWAGWMLLGAR